MTILTEKEREDVYKYWLHSSTLTNEDGLIQLAEKAVLEKLAGMSMPEPGGRVQRYDSEGTPYSEPTEDYTADQLHQAFAQGAASVLSAEPTFWSYRTNGVHEHIIPMCPPDDAYDEGTLKPLYTLMGYK